jgi:hypothetical protein
VSWARRKGAEAKAVHATAREREVFIGNNSTFNRQSTPVEDEKQVYQKGSRKEP